MFEEELCLDAVGDMDGDNVESDGVFVDGL